jgi:hypothetical protein
MASLESLPTEVLDSIIEALPPSSLYTLSLTNKRFSNLVNPLLYRHVRFSRSNCHQSILFLCTLLEQPNIATLVRHFTLLGWESWKVNKSSRDSIRMLNSIRSRLICNALRSVGNSKSEIDQILGMMKLCDLEVVVKLLLTRLYALNSLTIQLPRDRGGHFILDVGSDLSCTGLHLVRESSDLARFFQSPRYSTRLNGNEQWDDSQSTVIRLKFPSRHSFYYSPQEFLKKHNRQSRKPRPSSTSLSIISGTVTESLINRHLLSTQSVKSLIIYSQVGDLDRYVFLDGLVSQAPLLKILALGNIPCITQQTYQPGADPHPLTKFKNLKLLAIPLHYLVGINDNPVHAPRQFYKALPRSITEIRLLEVVRPWRDLKYGLLDCGKFKAELYPDLKGVYMYIKDQSTLDINHEELGPVQAELEDSRIEVGVERKHRSTRIILQSLALSGFLNNRSS